MSEKVVVAVALGLGDAGLLPPGAPRLPGSAGAAQGTRAAVLQGEGAPLATVLDDLAELPGAPTTVRLVGVSCAATAPPISWLSRVAGDWLRKRRAVGAVTPTLEVARNVARLPGDFLWAAGVRDDASAEVGSCIAAAAAGPARTVTGEEAGLTSSAWEAAPAHRHHLLICRGIRCSARGADLISATFTAQLRRQGLGDQDVLVAHTACLYPCNHAPLARVHPCGTWLLDLKPDGIAALVRAHLSPDAGGSS